MAILTMYSGNTKISLIFICAVQSNFRVSWMRNLLFLNAKSAWSAFCKMPTSTNKGLVQSEKGLEMGWSGRDGWDQHLLKLFQILNLWCNDEPLERSPGTISGHYPISGEWQSGRTHFMSRSFSFSSMMAFFPSFLLKTFSQYEVRAALPT